MRDKHIILISGKAGAGKDTMAETIAQITEPGQTQRVAFADEIKRVAREHFGWDGQKDDRGRELLQEIGMSGVKYDRLIWCKKSLPTIENSPSPIIAITDCRLLHELDWANSLGYPITTVRIVGRGGLTGDRAKHQSEVGLDHITSWDFVVDNSGTIIDLRSMAIEICKSRYLI